MVSIQAIYEGQYAEPAPWGHKIRYSALYAASAKQADPVLANSYSTKRDIVQHYGVDTSRSCLTTSERCSSERAATVSSCSDPTIGISTMAGT